MISVLMLTYNREQLVGRAIKSILEQTYQNFELIVVNNGSTDRSGEIAENYSKEDPRIKVIHRERGNIGAGRNTALDAARGEYITFMDDDDWVEPDFLEFLSKLITKNDADMSICGVDKTEKGVIIPMPVFDKIIMNTEEALIELMQRKRYNNGFPTKLFKKSLFDDLKFPETARYDDIHLMYKIISKANKVVSHCIPKYHVYRHDTNNSIATTKYGNITPEYLSEYRSAYRQRTEFLVSNFGNLEAMWRYFEQSFLISMVHKVIENNLTDCHSHLEEMQFELNSCREDFINCPWSQEFEKEWMLEHIPAN